METIEQGEILQLRLADTWQEKKKRDRCDWLPARCHGNACWWRSGPLPEDTKTRRTARVWPQCGAPHTKCWNKGSFRLHLQKKCSATEQLLNNVQVHKQLFDISVVWSGDIFYFRRKWKHYFKKEIRMRCCYMDCGAWWWTILLGNNWQSHIN